MPENTYVVLLTLNLDLVVVRLVERGVAIAGVAGRALSIAAVVVAARACGQIRFRERRKMMHT